MPDWDKILAQVAVVTSAPVPFLIAVFIAGGLIWWLLDWRYGAIVAQRDGVISNRDSEITLLKSQRDDYKDKLNGATPDQAKARIDSLEARLASVEPRRLTASERAGLIVRLTPPIGSPRAISIISEASGDSHQLAADFASVFRSSGDWKISEPTVMGLGNRPPSGIGVQVPDTNNPSKAATIVMDALRSQNIRFDLQQAPGMPGMELALLVCTKIER
jgi:hypothetical protein